MIAAPIEWALCWAAYRVVLLLPVKWRLCFALLPYAGVYAYTDGGFAEYRADRTGFCTMAPGNYLAMCEELDAVLIRSLAEEPKP